MVREERHQRANEPEREGDDYTALEIGDAGELVERDDSLRVRVGGCWYDVLDTTAGVRAYTRGKKPRRWWLGFYNHR